MTEKICFDFTALRECFADSLKYWSLTEDGAVVADYDGTVLAQGRVIPRDFLSELLDDLQALRDVDWGLFNKLWRKVYDFREGNPPEATDSSDSAIGEGNRG